MFYHMKVHQSSESSGENRRLCVIQIVSRAKKTSFDLIQPRTNSIWIQREASCNYASYLKYVFFRSSGKIHKREINVACQNIPRLPYEYSVCMWR